MGGRKAGPHLLAEKVSDPPAGKKVVPFQPNSRHQNTGVYLEAFSQKREVPIPVGCLPPPANTSGRLRADNAGVYVRAILQPMNPPIPWGGCWGAGVERRTVLWTAETSGHPVTATGGPVRVFGEKVQGQHMTYELGRLGASRVLSWANRSRPCGWSLVLKQPPGLEPEPLVRFPLAAWLLRPPGWPDIHGR